MSKSRVKKVKHVLAGYTSSEHITFEFDVFSRRKLYLTRLFPDRRMIMNTLLSAKP